MTSTSREQVERVARIYHHTADACAALGITLRSFSRLCRKYQVESPHDRKCRMLHEFRGPRRAVAAG